MNRRMVGLIVAVVLAAIATAALYLYVNRADERAAEEFDLRRVYVATQRIEAGTPAEAATNQGLIQQRELPDTAVAEGAIGSLEQIEGLVTTVPIVQGQQIVAENFGESSQVSTGTDLEIPEGHHAVSVDLSVVPGVAGFIDAGDSISILSLIAVDGGVPDAEPEPDEDGEPPPPVADAGLQARYLLQNVEVLAVGQRVTTFDENGNPTGKAIQESNDTFIFTVALSPSDVEKLVFAKSESTLWATLQPELEEDPESGEDVEFEPFTTPGANVENLFQ